MSRAMIKPDFCLGENKATDQLRSDCDADQRLCLRYTDNTIPPLLISKIKKKSKVIAIFCSCIARLADLVGNPENRFSRVATQN